MVKVDVFRAVRRFCLNCQGDSAQGIRQCPDQHCPLWPWRLPEAGLRGASPCSGAPDTTGFVDENTTTAAEPPSAITKNVTRRAMLRAIRTQCMTCAGCRQDVRSCAANTCALWHLRFGVMPLTYRTVRTRFFSPKQLTLF